MRIVTVICTRMCARKKNKRKEEREMPILQYKCTKCGKRFEELVKVYTDKVPCPDCGGETIRDYSGEMYSSTGKQTKKSTGHCATCGGGH